MLDCTHLRTPLHLQASEVDSAPSLFVVGATLHGRLQVGGGSAHLLLLCAELLRFASDLAVGTWRCDALAKNCEKVATAPEPDH
eukprot:6098327-Alexandrium_andersonii.AAC.1